MKEESPSVRRGPGKGQTSARSPQFIRHLLSASRSKNLPICGERGASSLSDTEDRVSRAGLECGKASCLLLQRKVFSSKHQKRALLFFWPLLLFWKILPMFFFFWEEQIFQRGKAVFVLFVLAILVFSFCYSNCNFSLLFMCKPCAFPCLIPFNTFCTLILLRYSEGL